jgi:hypothetical protein
MPGTLNAIFPPQSHTYDKMTDFDAVRPGSRAKKFSVIVILSYAFDWLIMVIVGLIGYFLGNVTPNKRPFSLFDANISYVLSIELTYP